MGGGGVDSPQAWSGQLRPHRVGPTAGPGSGVPPPQTEASGSRGKRHTAPARKASGRAEPVTR